MGAAESCAKDGWCRTVTALGGDFANEPLLGGQRVLPNKALTRGFVFRHETLRSAFDAIL
jgi:uncharacterized protein